MHSLRLRLRNLFGKISVYVLLLGKYKLCFVIKFVALHLELQSGK